ncbi:hypothetical protein Pmani_024527 [Petrolisthes manimaculis]|uniref:Uncharacterized protein n=1 Tax=Petrolisthes manimaculis TaxID=1843537 RepID=A0AAE1TYK7_9EUCA|nr:hypothetical protein Pmani_024527 [Petrolisthes manimaculis]
MGSNITGLFQVAEFITVLWHGATSPSLFLYPLLSTPPSPLHSPLYSTPYPSLSLLHSPPDSTPSSLLYSCMLVPARSLSSFIPVSSTAPHTNPPIFRPPAPPSYPPTISFTILPTILVPTPHKPTYFQTSCSPLLPSNHLLPSFSHHPRTHHPTFLPFLPPPVMSSASSCFSTSHHMPLLPNTNFNTNLL